MEENVSPEEEPELSANEQFFEDNCSQQLEYEDEILSQASITDCAFSQLDSLGRPLRLSDSYQQNEQLLLEGRRFLNF